MAGQLNIGVISVPGFYRDVEAESQGDKNYRSTTRDVTPPASTNCAPKARSMA